MKPIEIRDLAIDALAAASARGFGEVSDRVLTGSINRTVSAGSSTGLGDNNVPTNTVEGSLNKPVSGSDSSGSLILR